MNPKASLCAGLPGIHSHHPLPFPLAFFCLCPHSSAPFPGGHLSKPPSHTPPLSVSSSKGVWLALVPFPWEGLEAQGRHRGDIANSRKRYVPGRPQSRSETSGEVCWHVGMQNEASLHVMMSSDVCGQTLPASTLVSMSSRAISPWGGSSSAYHFGLHRTLIY